MSQTLPTPNAPLHALPRSLSHPMLSHPLPSIARITDMELKGKLLFLRLDLNVPLSEPDSEGERTILDDSRIVEALPTIQYAIEQGARILIASHLGRPDGKVKAEFSLEPVAQYLAKNLDVAITLADDCVGDGIRLMANTLKDGQILMLQNLRFHAGEEANDPDFAHALARLADVYVTDAFGTSHRKHASTYGVPALMPVKGMGYLLEKEIRFLDLLLEQPEKPFYLLLGGAKVSDKLKTIQALMRNLNGIAVGGAMAFAFLEAQGTKTPDGAKQPKPEDVESAKLLLAEAKRKNIPLLLPEDTHDGFDIGPKSIAHFSRFLADARTLFWNGPLGWFEKPEYSQGTFEVAKAIAGYDCFKVVGGGDTVSAVKQSGLADRFDHLSTGGGAALEYLEGNSLPGIDILKRKISARKSESPKLDPLS